MCVPRGTQKLMLISASPRPRVQHTNFPLTARRQHGLRASHKTRGGTVMRFLRTQMLHEQRAPIEEKCWERRRQSCAIWHTCTLAPHRHAQFFSHRRITVCWIYTGSCYEMRLEVLMSVALKIYRLLGCDAVSFPTFRKTFLEDKVPLINSTQQRSWKASSR